jgi:hypothetical protein
VLIIPVIPAKYGNKTPFCSLIDSYFQDIGYDKCMKTTPTLMLAVVCIGAGILCMGCEHVDAQENDTHQDSGAEETDADSETVENDAGQMVRIASACDDLSDDDCQDSDPCAPMWVEPTGHVSGSDALWAGCQAHVSFGCTSMENCYTDIEVALAPDGTCWWMRNGCLPDEPGWMPAIDDDDCKSPVRVHSCIE